MATRYRGCAGRVPQDPPASGREGYGPGGTSNAAQPFPVLVYEDYIELLADCSHETLSPRFVLQRSLRRLRRDRSSRRVWNRTRRRIRCGDVDAFLEERGAFRAMRRNNESVNR